MKTTSTGHTLTIRNGTHLDIEGDLDTMQSIPDVEIENYCIAAGYTVDWTTNGETWIRVERVEVAS
jgi:hypothetical protein